MSFVRGILFGAAAASAVAASVAVVGPISFDGAVAEARAPASKLWHEYGDDRPAPALPAGFSPLPSLAPLIKTLKPAVVSVSTTSVVRGARGGGSFDDFFRPFYGQDPRQRGGRVMPRSQGSGFIIHESGLVLTNNHVIEGADAIQVKLADGREFKAQLVGRDPKTDVAVIRLENAKKLPTVFLGNSDQLEVGDWVVAIGNPFGLSHSVSMGIVSAKERFIGAGPYDDFIQTDAAINPGNSGGPLFNSRGEVIGINTAIIAHGQGIGFAVPINLVKALVPQIEKTGTVARGFLGVTLQEMTPEIARSLGLDRPHGALIAEVLPGSPAEGAGLKPGDVIVSMDGRDIDGHPQLSRTVALLPPGAGVALGVLRDGDRIKVDVKVAARDDNGRILPASGEQKRERGQGDGGVLGLSVGQVDATIARSLGLRRAEGVVVTDVDPDGPAARQGIEPDDVILEINRQPVRNLAQYREVTRSLAPGDMVLLRLQRGNSAVYVAVRTGR